MNRIVNYGLAAALSLTGAACDRESEMAAEPKPSTQGQDTLEATVAHGTEIYSTTTRPLEAIGTLAINETVGVICRVFPEALGGEVVRIRDEKGTEDMSLPFKVKQGPIIPWRL